MYIEYVDLISEGETVPPVCSNTLRQNSVVFSDRSNIKKVCLSFQLDSSVNK